MMILSSMFWAIKTLTLCYQESMPTMELPSSISIGPRLTFRVCMTIGLTTQAVIFWQEL